MAFDPDAYLANKGFDPDKYLNGQQPQAPKYTGLTAAMFGQDVPEPIKAMGSFASGGNSLIPALLGLPVDTATNLANLGIAGYGALKGLLPKNRNAAGVADAPNLPDTLGPQFLGSQSIKGMFENAIGSPIMSPQGSDSLNQNLHMMGGITTSGLLAPSQSAQQALRNVASMVPSAIGAVGMKEAFPDQPLAPAVGALVTPAAIQTIKTIPKTQVGQSAQKAVEMGFKLLPKHIKDSRVQDITQGVAGTVPTKQLASVKNQSVIQSMIKKELGLADDVPLTAETLSGIRSEAGKAYNAMSKYGQVNADKTYMANMRKLAKPAAIAKDFPGSISKDHVAEVQTYARKQMSSEGIVEAVKQLRKDSSAGYISPDPKVKNMAILKKNIADELENLLIRTTEKTALELAPNLKAARETIAKTYTIEKAIKPNDSIDITVFAKELSKNKPLSGTLKDLAVVGRDFPEVVQWKPPQTTNVRGMDVIAGVLGGTVDPKLIALVGVRPALRKVLLSKRYQNFTANVPSKKIESVLSLPESKQAGALIFLLEEAKNQESESPPNSQ